MVEWPDVGVKYDAGKDPIALLDSFALTQLAKVLGYGEFKYEAHNWRKGMAWSRVYSAAQRHLLAWNDGEDIDPESGLPHLAHAFCCIMFLLNYSKTHQEKDDRYDRRE